jgi:hypothetical protein
MRDEWDPEIIAKLVDIVCDVELRAIAAQQNVSQQHVSDE